MQLALVRVVGIGPFEDLTIPLCDADGVPRKVAVVLGGGGVGKTSLLTAIASTRPGYAVAPLRTRQDASKETPFVVTDWVLGDDSPARPHPLRVASPNALLQEPEELSVVRRREQLLFDRRATTQGGFVLVAFTSARWFSRSSVLLTSPERTVGRYDVRAAVTLEDATRADLTRDTKQALAYAAIAASLAHNSSARVEEPIRIRMEALERTLHDVVNGLVRLAGFAYAGVDPLSLEPKFESEEGGLVFFDELPTSVRHLVALGTLTVRALYAAYPDRDPRFAEGVVLVDDAPLHQEASVQRSLVPTLRRVLPRVQWILTGSSAALSTGCELSEVLALRRMPTSRRVELYQGELATLH